MGNRSTASQAHRIAGPVLLASRSPFPHNFRIGTLRRRTIRQATTSSAVYSPIHTNPYDYHPFSLQSLPSFSDHAEGWCSVMREDQKAGARTHEKTRTVAWNVVSVHVQQDLILLIWTSSSKSPICHANAAFFPRSAFPRSGTRQPLVLLGGRPRLQSSRPGRPRPLRAPAPDKGNGTERQALSSPTAPSKNCALFDQEYEL